MPSMASLSLPCVLRVCHRAGGIANRRITRRRASRGAKTGSEWLVAGLLEERVGPAGDIGFVDLFDPGVRLDILDAYRHRLLGTVRAGHDGPGDFFRELSFLLLRSSGVELDDHVRHS